MYSMLKDLFDKYLVRPRYKLTFRLTILLLFNSSLAHSNNDLSANGLPIAGDWLYQSTHQMALLHISPDTSYSHVFINLDEPNSSFHHWGRITQQADILQFIPSELVFYQQSLVDAQRLATLSLTTQPAPLPQTTTNLLTQNLVTRPIQYSLSAANSRLTLSSQYGDINILGKQYQSLEPHHTFGYWPDKLAIDTHYFVIFASGYYAQVYSSTDQAINAEFLWGRLF